jgi:hypothetical protein
MLCLRKLPTQPGTATWTCCLLGAAPKLATDPGSNYFNQMI